MAELPRLVADDDETTRRQLDLCHVTSNNKIVSQLIRENRDTFCQLMSSGDSCGNTRRRGGADTAFFNTGDTRSVTSRNTRTEQHQLTTTTTTTRQQRQQQSYVTDSGTLTRKEEERAEAVITSDNVDHHEAVVVGSKTVSRCWAEGENKDLTNWGKSEKLNDRFVSFPNFGNFPRFPLMMTETNGSTTSPVLFKKNVTQNVVTKYKVLKSKNTSAYSTEKYR